MKRLSFAPQSPLRASGTDVGGLAPGLIENARARETRARGIARPLKVLIATVMFVSVVLVGAWHEEAPGQARPQAPVPPLIQYWPSDLTATAGLESALASLSISPNPAPPTGCPASGGVPCPTPGTPAVWGFASALHVPHNGIAHDQFRGYIYSITGAPGSPASWAIHVNVAGALTVSPLPTATGLPTSIAMVATPPPPYPVPPCASPVGDSFAVAESNDLDPAMSPVINVYNYPVLPPSTCLPLLASFNLATQPGMGGATIEHIYGNTAGFVAGVAVDLSGDSWVFTVNFSVSPPQIGSPPTLLHRASAQFVNESLVYDPANSIWWFAASNDGTNAPWHTGGRLYVWSPGQFAPTRVQNLTGVSGGVALVPDPNMPFPRVGTCPSGNCQRAVFLLEQIYDGNPSWSMKLHRIGWDVTPGLPVTSRPVLDWTCPPPPPSQQIVFAGPAPQLAQNYVFGPIGVDRDGNVLCGGFDVGVTTACGPQAWGPAVVPVNRCGGWVGSLICTPWVPSGFQWPFCPLRFPNGDVSLSWRTQRGFQVP